MKTVIHQFKSINLHTLDKIFLIIFTSIVLFLFYYGMSVITFGGIVLIYGAFLTYKGQIFLSVGSYLAADLCWVTNAYINNDWQGVLFLTMGIIFGLIATWKMKNGDYERDIVKK